MNTANEVKSAINIVCAVADAIRELKSVPSGHLYARLMEHMDLATYEKIIGILKGAGLVKEENYLLTWIEPEKKD